MVQEAKQAPKKVNYTISKEDFDGEESDNNNEQPQQRQVTETIVRDSPKINRNETVTIKNISNGALESMKYKKAESLLASGQWVLA